MIEIVKGRIYWYEGYANPPNLQVLLSRIPALSEHRFEKRGTVYYSEVDGVCQFFSWGGSQDRGYGGRAFPIKMRDGSDETLLGPWSSNFSAVNSLGFGPCIEVHGTDEPEAYQRGYTFCACSVTMSMLGDFRQRIEVPPYRFSSLDTPWKGFDRKLVFPEGTKFTVLETDKEGRRVIMEASGEQASALHGLPQFIPILQLPDGRYWLKPRNGGTPEDLSVGRVEDIDEGRPWPQTVVGGPAVE